MGWYADTDGFIRIIHQGRGAAEVKQAARAVAERIGEMAEVTLASTDPVGGSSVFWVRTTGKCWADDDLLKKFSAQEDVQVQIELTPDLSPDEGRVMYHTLAGGMVSKKKGHVEVIWDCGEIL